MKTTPRNRRSDSAAAALKAAKNADAETLKPPGHVHLPAEARKFWPEILANRPRDRWNALDLTNAVELARMYADMERLRKLISKEGDLVKGKPHPAHKLLEATGRRAVSLARMLHLHPEATEGRARDAGNTLKGEQQARAAKRDHADDLIPRAH